MTSSIRILGVYRMDPTPELFAEAMEIKYGGLDLEPDERRDAEASVREELADVVLIELVVEGRDDRFDMGDFGQPGLDQAPYLERFLSDDGAQVIAEDFDVPEGPKLRCAFFLHLFDPARPLTTSHGPVAVPEVQPMPERLRKLAPYEPVG